MPIPPTGIYPLGEAEDRLLIVELTTLPSPAAFYNLRGIPPSSYQGHGRIMALLLSLGQHMGCWFYGIDQSLLLQLARQTGRAGAEEIHELMDRRLVQVRRRRHVRTNRDIVYLLPAAIAHLHTDPALQGFIRG